MKTTLIIACALCTACAMGSSREPTATTSAQRGAEQAQKSSEEALKQAQKAQEQASEKQESASEAQRDVETKERELIEARQKAAEERQQAEQAQTQAQQETQAAAQRASSAQERARESQRQANERAGEEAQQRAREAEARAQQQSQRPVSGQSPVASSTTSGRIVEVHSDHVILERQNAPRLTVKVDPNTAVSVAGQRTAAQELRVGSEVRVEYRLVGNQPVAVSIQTTSPTGQGAPLY